MNYELQAMFYVVKYGMDGAAFLTPRRDPLDSGLGRSVDPCEIETQTKGTQPAAVSFPGTFSSLGGAPGAGGETGVVTQDGDSTQDSRLHDWTIIRSSGHDPIRRRG
jgi:hypothetical protein